MLYVVTKSPVGISAQELIGVFTDETKAAGACVGAGTYYVARVEPDRLYKIGTLLDVEVRVVTSVEALKVR
jgi:hypothetical protein